MSSRAAGTCYRFDRFVLDTMERRLTDGDREIHLRPKTFDTLAYLLEHRGRLVRKAAMLDALWPSTEVVENALPQCVRELRDALGDDQRHPRFLETIPRAGYRFIADVQTEVIADEEDGDTEEEITSVSMVIAEDDGVPAAGTVAPARRLGRHRLAWAAGVGAIVVAVGVAAGWWRVTRAGSPVTSERRWLLVADLDNLTGNKAFDAVLRADLERELSVSRRINVVPRGRIVDALRLMRLAPDTPVTEDVAREVCLRDGGIRAVLSGSIQGVGGSYAVALKLFEPHSGTTIAAFTERARDAGSALDAIARLSQAVRRSLGDLSDQPRARRPPERVTTPSADALALYSSGLAAMDQFEWGQAEVLFGQAAERDPEFALGYLFRGVARMMISRDSRGDFERAVELERSVTPRERMMVDACAAMAGNDQARTIDLFEALLVPYPEDYWGHELASWTYFFAGNHAAWRTHQAACRRLRPNFAQPHFHAAWVSLMFDGDVDAASAEYARVLELNPTFSSGTAQAWKAFVAWMRGDVDRASEEFARFRAGGMAHLSAVAQYATRPQLARFYLFAGNPSEALSMLETSRDMTFADSDAAVTAAFPLERALVYQAMGRDSEAGILLQEAAAKSVGLERVEALGWLAITRARHGDGGRARALLREIAAEAREPVFDLWHPRLPAQLDHAKRAFGDVVEGELLMRAGRTADAVKQFDEVRRNVTPHNALFATILGPRVWLAAVQSSARAHGQLGDFAAALADNEAILSHKVLCLGTGGASTIWIAALASAGEAAERAGRTDAALRFREEYRRLRPTTRQGS
jgi:DNA-binding winged helix-turn-helix (wHTH) protein/tetratricopeptide (TPR) repeat protein